MTGKYQIRYKVRDAMGEESSWSPARRMEIVDRMGNAPAASLAVLSVGVIIVLVCGSAAFLLWRRHKSKPA